MDLGLWYNVTSSGAFDLRAPLPLLAACSPPGLVQSGTLQAGRATMASNETLRLQGEGNLSFAVRMHGTAPAGCDPGPDSGWTSNRTWEADVLPWWLDAGNVTLTVDLRHDTGNFCRRIAGLSGTGSVPGQGWLSGEETHSCV